MKPGSESGETDQVVRARSRIAPPFCRRDEHGRRRGVAVTPDVGVKPGRVHLESARHSIHQVLIGLMHQENFYRRRGLSVSFEQLADRGWDFAGRLQDHGAAVHLEGRSKFEPQILGESTV